MPPRRAAAKGKAAAAAKADVDTDVPASAAAAASSSSPTGKRKAEDDDTAADADNGDADAAADAAADAEPEAKQPAKKQKKDDNAAVAPASAASASADVDLSGKKFIVIGGFTAGKWKVESAVNDVGGIITKAAAKSVAYCVCGTPVRTDYGGVSGPGSKIYKDCKKMKVPILKEEEFFKLVETYKAGKDSATAQAGAALIPDLANIVSEYASDKDGIGAKWEEIGTMTGFKPQSGVTAEKIAEAEQKIQAALPPYLKSLLRVADGAHKYEGDADLPGRLWESLDEIVRLNTNSQMLKQHKFLCINGESEQNCTLYIDLRTNWLIEISVEPDMDGVFGMNRSLEDRVQRFYDLVKPLHNAFQDRLKAAGEDVTELDLLRKEAIENKKKYDELQKDPNSSKEYDRVARFSRYDPDNYFTAKTAASSSSTPAASAGDADAEKKKAEAKEVAYLRSLFFGVSYQDNVDDKDFEKQLASSYKNKMMNAFCKITFGQSYSSMSDW